MDSWTALTQILDFKKMNDTVECNFLNKVLKNANNEHTIFYRYTMHFTQIMLMCL